jgi:carboxylesterase
VLGAPFDLPGDDRGVLCVHGFTGSPYEMRYLGERLHARGYSVLGPALPGHGSTVEDLEATAWQDWVAGVDDAYHRLLSRCRQVCVVGLSLGGLLTLYLATQRPGITAIASLAAPLWFDGLGGLAARWLGPGGALAGVRRLPKVGGSDVRDPRVRRENPSYPVIPTRAFNQLTACMRVVDDALPQVAAPLLVLHANQDHTAPVASARRIARLARAERLRLLPDSYHLITVDIERDIVAAEVGVFFDRHCQRSATAHSR